MLHSWTFSLLNTFPFKHLWSVDCSMLLKEVFYAHQGKVKTVVL